MVENKAMTKLAKENLLDSKYSNLKVVCVEVAKQKQSFKSMVHQKFLDGYLEIHISVFVSKIQQI